MFLSCSQQKHKSWRVWQCGRERVPRLWFSRGCGGRCGGSVRHGYLPLPSHHHHTTPSMMAPASSTSSSSSSLTHMGLGAAPSTASPSSSSSAEDFFLGDMASHLG
ncbi:hypothetical protein Pcinc_016009 [Petrolisthes cinctipes]|uniref:Uncharacterized protein n=1 Tax=Petrolisthes cinctipes TaxID=88211 RepID=A0AAE1KMF2_PETCI|nr:hypothetical protein Pcinc_016009 [Petrolisthes cinctipes]